MADLKKEVADMVKTTQNINSTFIIGTCGLIVAACTLFYYKFTESKEYKIHQGIDKACQPWQPQLPTPWIQRVGYEQKVKNAYSHAASEVVNVLLGEKGSGKSSILQYSLQKGPGNVMNASAFTFHRKFHRNPPVVIYLELRSSTPLLAVIQRIVKQLTDIDASDEAGLLSVFASL